MKQLTKILGFVAVIIAFGAISGCGKSKASIDLNKYVIFSVEGYDSMGEAYCEFDYDSFEHDYAGKIEVNEEYANDLGLLAGITGKSNERVLIETCVEQMLDRDYDLSNGDKVTMNWSCDDELARDAFNVTLEYSDIEYTVEGLKEVALLNPFDYVEVTFSGIQPNGSLIVNPDYDQPEIQYINYTADRSNELKNGDIVTVTASITGSIDSFVEKFGCVLEETEKEYTVDSLASYVTQVDKIPEETMEKMVSQGEDTYKSYIANDWSHPENLISIKLAGNYFLTLKPGMDAEPHNYLYLVYEVQATNPDPVETVDLYYYICYQDIIEMADGTCSVDINNYIVPTASSWESKPEYFNVGDYRYVGYQDLDALYNNCVMTKIVAYEYTTTITNRK